MRFSRLATLAATLLATACSTTRVLQEGEYRLASNKVEITGDTDLRASGMSQYILQQPNTSFLFGWNPFVNVYNWRNGSGKGLDKVWEKIGQAPVVFNSGSVTNSEENIANHLEYLGYYGSDVRATVDTVRRNVKVKYTITPGRQYPIDSIYFVTPPGNLTFDEEFAHDLPNVSVSTGSRLSESALEAESARSAQYFNNLGYYDFSKNNYFFEADTLQGRTILKYEIRNYSRNENESDASPLTKYKFGDVSISHSSNIPFNDNILLKLNTIQPGRTYNPRTVNNTYSRLSSLKVFNGVGIELTPSDSATVDCRIRLSESKMQGFKANLEASTNSSGLIGISPRLSWHHKNIFHGAEWLSVGFNGNFQFKPNSIAHSTELGLSATLGIPGFIGLPFRIFRGPNIPTTEIKANFNWQDRPEYTRNITDLSYGYSGQFTRRFFFQIYPVKVKFVHLYNVSDDFAVSIIKNPFLAGAFLDHLDAGLNGNFIWTDNTDIVPKKPYRSVRFSFGTSGNLISLFNGLLKEEYGEKVIFDTPYSQYVKAELTYTQAFRFGADNGQSLAFRLMGCIGHAYGNSTTIPFEEQFYGGGASSMRGWQARTIGPGTSPYKDIFVIPSQTGDFKLEADLEYRFAMFWKLEGALFGEAGNIWILSNGLKDFTRSIGLDWGLGLRLNLDFILVRLDAGFRVYDPVCVDTDPAGPWKGPDRWFRNDGYAIHFGVGYPF